MLGGMGVDISVPELALEIARLGGIGHISDAMAPVIADKRFHTTHVMQKLQRYRAQVGKQDKSGIVFDLEALGQAIRQCVDTTISAKRGDGAIFINCMEKLTMSNPRETLRVRLNAALDAGIDGITLSAGLHLSSMELMRDHPRFREVKIGIIVSSVRALKVFLSRAARMQRLPDYIIVEGPLAGGHLGFPLNWQDFDLAMIVGEVLQLLRQESLVIPVIPAGGIFTGTDAVALLEGGASAVQVATRFTITRESGLPDNVKQEFFCSDEEDVEVNTISATGYPMRMLKRSPAIGAGMHPSCEAYGYLLDTAGNCPYLSAYYQEAARQPRRIRVQEKTCLCAQMRAYNVWTCGQNVFRLKDTTHQLTDGQYQLLTAEHVFNDYLHSTDHEISLPEKEICLETRETVRQHA